MRMCVAFLTAIAGLASNIAIAQTSIGLRGVPTSSTLSQYGLEVAWSGQAVMNPARDKVEHLSIDEEVVLVHGTNGVVTAFDAENGQRLWAQRVGRFDAPGFPPVTNDETVFVVVGPMMYGLEKLTGDIAWRMRLPSAASTGPAASDKHVFVGTLDGSVYAFSLKKIRQLYQEQRLPEWSNETIVWRFQAAEEITSPPTPIDSAVNFASRDGSLYSLATDRRRLIYQFEANAPILAPTTMSGTMQFIAAEDSTLYAINAINGTTHWEVVTGLPVRRAPVALGNTLYVMPERGGFFAFTAENGDRRWWRPQLTAFVSLLGDTVVARDVSGNLELLENESGALVGRIPAAYFDRQIVNDRSDRIYLATSRGELMAIRTAGRNFPIFHRYPERRPILPEFAPEEGTEAAAEESSSMEEPTAQ